MLLESITLAWVFFEVFVCTCIYIHNYEILVAYMYTTIHLYVRVHVATSEYYRYDLTHIFTVLLYDFHALACIVCTVVLYYVTSCDLHDVCYVLMFSSKALGFIIIGNNYI